MIRSEAFFSLVDDLSIGDLATLRGVSRQFAARDLERFLSDKDGIRRLHDVLVQIGSTTATKIAEKVARYATTELKLDLESFDDGEIASGTNFADLLRTSQEVWLLASSPMDYESPRYWEALCTDFLRHPDKMLVYFVSTLEAADRLAFRFEDEILPGGFERQVAEQPESDHPFLATIFIVVTNLVSAMPYTLLTNPRSGATRASRGSATWIMGKNGETFVEAPPRSGDTFVQHVRAAGLGVARQTENFFPLGQRLMGDSGIPFRAFRHVDHLIAVKGNSAVGLFEGDPVSSRRDEELTRNQVERGAPTPTTAEKSSKDHPLKIYPVFIKAYRKKSGEHAKRLTTETKVERSYFRF